MRRYIFLRLVLAALVLPMAARVSPLLAQSAPAGAQKSAPLPSPPAEKIAIPGVHNAGKVTSLFFRGSSPKPEAFAELKKLGVSTVIDLRWERGQIESERKRVEALGMKFVSLPLSGWFSPKNDQVAQFLKTLREHPVEKVFVHCHFGDDRTGVLVAAYRIAEQHWTAEQAIKEMDQFHFHDFWHPNMKSYVRKFPAAFASDPVFASLRSPQTPPPAYRR